MPKAKRKIFDGDLVRVVYLPPYMSHFSRMTGVVCESEDYGFFIQGIDSKGRVVKNSKCGWYHEENVELLCKDYYHRGEYKQFDIKSLKLGGVSCAE